jgi:copper chaperone
MLRFIIPSMTCGGCAKAVTRIVQSVTGPGTTVDIDLATHEVRVGAGTDQAPALLGALAKGGYPAERRDEAPVAA